MISDFAANFDSYRSAYEDMRLYLEAKGYRSEGYSTYWEPQHEVDLEPEQAYGPGAMAVGELDELYQNNDEPYLGFDEFDEF